MAARRMLFFIEWALIVIFALGLLGILIDLPSAWQANPCSPNDPSHCYPWGAEGPAADYWNYASKRHYLASSIFGASVASATLLGAFIVSRSGGSGCCWPV